MDGARNAKACLSLHIGSHNVVIERLLSDLTLKRLEIDDQEVKLMEENLVEQEDLYQKEIIKLVGVSSFGDWILLLRFLTFYFEDRRALVWDQSAQKQILRMLLLSTPKARRWTEDERDILELDSRMRNLRATVGREEGALAKNKSKEKTGDNVRDELEKLASQQETDTELYEHLENELLEIDKARRQARLRALKSEQEHEAQFRAIERIKLAAIESQFPSRSETARYILAQLLTDQMCIVCGNHVPEVAAEYADRVEHAQCVVCGSDITNSEVLSSTDDDGLNSEVEQAVANLRDMEANLVEARRALKEAEADYQSHTAELEELRKRINDRSREIDLLVRQLPPEEAEMHKQQSQLASMRDRVEELKIELNLKRELFGKFVEKVNLA